MSAAKEAGSSPFQATKLWNQMIRNFREGIELRKRRWKMRMYDKTFCGSDAVDWFLLYLRSNQKFGNHVTRVQAKQLLQKFLENAIFEDPRGKNSKSFEDDNHLYRFTEKADQICQNKKEITTQRSVTNLIRSVSIRRDKNPIVSEESDGTSKVVRNRNLRRVARSQSMRQALTSPSNSVIQRESIGVTPLSTNLAGFKIDSSKKPDVSTEQEENRSSMPSVNEESNSSCQEEERNTSNEHQQELDQSVEEAYTSILQQAGIDNRAFIVEDMSPLVTTFSRTRSLRDPKMMRYRHKFVVNCDEEDLINEPNLNLHKSLRRSLKRSKSNRMVSGLKFTKTDQCESPSKKRRVDENGVEDSKPQNLEELSAAGGDLMHSSKTSESGLRTRGTMLTSRNRSDSSMYQSKQQHRLSSVSNSQITSRQNSYKSAGKYMEIPWKSVTLASLGEVLGAGSLDGYINLALLTDNDIKTNAETELKSAEIPEWVLSAMKFLVKWPDKADGESDSSLPSYSGFECDVYHAILDHYESSLKEPLMTFNLFKLLELATESIDADKTKAVSVFQFISLLIPPWNRKQVYLLLRFIVKISENQDLRISSDLSNKEMVLKSFHSILIRNKEVEFPEKDRLTSLKAVTFMLENHENVLKVPSELMNKVEQLSYQKSTELQSSSTRVAPPKKPRERPVSYCAKCSKEEYLNEAEDSTRKALLDLLNMISNDDTLPPKIKRKRLKMFKKNYPEIYQRKFPEDNISTCSTTSQRTLRIRQAIRPIFFSRRNSEF